MHGHYSGCIRPFSIVCSSFLEVRGGVHWNGSPAIALRQSSVDLPCTFLCYRRKPEYTEKQTEPPQLQTAAVWIMWTGFSLCCHLSLLNTSCIHRREALHKAETLFHQLSEQEAAKQPASPLWCHKWNQLTRHHGSLCKEHSCMKCDNYRIKTPLFSFLVITHVCRQSFTVPSF